MKNILSRLFDQEELSSDEAKDVLINITKGAYNPIQVAAFMTVFQMRSITVNELKGFQSALLSLCVPFNTNGLNTIDLCGTGGDGKNTFNISTLASFVVAGAGFKVTKHGNYGVSSKCGSSNVLEELGYHFSNDNVRLHKELDKANITFFHAPLFHPALKTVSELRRNYGVKTFFNMLGPLVNPANPSHQLTGVYNLSLARLYRYIQVSNYREFVVLHALDGYDEVSLTNAVKVYTNHYETIFTPTDLGLSIVDVSDLYGGETVKEAANIFLNILNGNGTIAQNNVVCANAAFAIQCFDSKKTFSECFEVAYVSLIEKKALKVFKTLISSQ